ncbi:YtxH domain-containing protein [Streptomyces sp. NPDC008121]|uniref:YtxH domain-containing protein n=1 Tax=Streptomyces sp. NPDC008121 TaxID=3364809 RepID=UPI0036EB4433
MRYKLTFVVGVALGYVIGTRAGRERYEQLKKSARDLSRNPAVRNAAESAAQTGREVAGKAMHVVSDKVGDKLPPSVTDRVHALRGHNGQVRGSGTDDDWGTSNT